MSSSKRVLMKYWFPVILWMAAIFTLSSFPDYYFPKNRPEYLSTIVHFIEYIILGLLFIRALTHSGSRLSSVSITVISILLASLYGVTDEIHQYFVPGREMVFTDWLVDFSGTVIGVVLYEYIERFSLNH
jgi:VanZ family protein